MLMFSLSQPLEKLGEILLQEFAGKSVNMADIYRQHSVDRPYVKKNYKDILWQLYDSGMITTNRKPRRGTFADDIVAVFPPTS